MMACTVGLPGDCCIAAREVGDRLVAAAGIEQQLGDVHAQLDVVRARLTVRNSDSINVPDTTRTLRDSGRDLSR